MLAVLGFDHFWTTTIYDIIGFLPCLDQIIYFTTQGRTEWVGIATDMNSSIKGSLIAGPYNCSLSWFWCTLVFEGGAVM